MDEFNRLVSIMAQLRSKGGCPWDIAQTHESIISCAIEEVHELMDAILAGDSQNMKEELGDVLMQVIFHSQMAQEAGNFSIKDVIEGICEKLIRRHPHVFGNVKAETPEKVKENWDQIKSLEKLQKSDCCLDGITRGIPPLIKAEKLQKKAAKVGFDWPNIQGPFSKVKEELHELYQEIKQQSNPAKDNSEKLKEEFGDVIFSLVNVARHLKLDCTSVLEAANQKFYQRFKVMEALIRATGSQLTNLTLEEMDKYWDKAKSEFKKSE